MKWIILIIFLIASSILIKISYNHFASVNISEITSNQKYPTIVAVGDLQCQPSSFFKNVGNCQKESQRVANLATSLKPNAVLLLGDEQYGRGTYQDFINSFDRVWGKLKPIIKPVPGNHEYNSVNATGYFKYFGEKSVGGIGKGYYSFNIDSWHIIALNSNCRKIGGCGSNSAEYEWLANDLKMNNKICTIAYFHHPLFSSGTHGNNLFMQPIWTLLYASNVDIVLNGHDHIYERFTKQNPQGLIDPNHGITEFVVGTGGGRLYKFAKILPTSLARDNKDYGVLRLTLEAKRYNWKFFSVNGDFKDSGSASCN